MDAVNSNFENERLIGTDYFNQHQFNIQLNISLKQLYARLAIIRLIYHEILIELDRIYYITNHAGSLNPDV